MWDGATESGTDSLDATPTREEIEARYNPKPSPLPYRLAVIVAPEDPSVVPIDAPEYEIIPRLAAKDRKFFRRLQDDK